MEHGKIPAARPDLGKGRALKKILKYVGSALIVLVIAISIYYGYAIYTADTYTHDIIAMDLKQSRWRSPGGTPQKFEIQSHDLNQCRREILIKVQDPGFYNHNGVDLSTPGAGLTTITQAIVKKLYFKKFTPGIAKIKQTLIARFVANNRISKDDQLTLFINAMYFGNCKEKPVVGLESAARAYYNRSVKMLTDDQYISLIAMLVMPGTFHVIDHPDWNRDRTNRIKALIAGRYKPKGLMDQFYGDLPREVIDSGLPPVSYFGK
jgi:membrane peptidoglycan carboxypeptidase